MAAPDRQWIVWHKNPLHGGDPMGGPHTSTVEQYAWAASFFDACVNDAQVNWVKWYTIRGTDGKYLFQAEHQRRTEQR